MKLSAIKNNTAFKSNLTIDIGGSQREGSCKIYYATNDDTPIFMKNTTVNEIGVSTFNGPDDFMNKIAEKVKQVQDGSRETIRRSGKSKDENTLRSMTLFIPSYTDGSMAYYLPNHRNQENRPLKDLDFSKMKELLLSKGVQISDNMRFRVLQDAMGTGLAVSKRLYNFGMLKPGKYYTACITGGGCGVSTIEMHDDDRVIVKSTGSGYLATSDRLEKVSRAGASAPAVIRNFCRPFGINEEMVEDIVGCHKAEFTMTNPISYEKNPKTEKLKALLLSTGKYLVTRENSKEFTISVFPEYEKLFNDCRNYAIEKYAQAFARLAAIKRNEACNGLIITGPLAKAIDEASSKYYKTRLVDRIKKHIFSSYNTFELEKMQKTYDFKVICDKRFFIDDNTACKKLAHMADYVAPGRGNWLQVPVSAFKD
ncbi:MAG: hypothetical protein K6A44_03700 [bacterium]|nr:hypothetical protein [bacterium]